MKDLLISVRGSFRAYRFLIADQFLRAQVALEGALIPGITGLTHRGSASLRTAPRAAPGLLPSDVWSNLKSCPDDVRGDQAHGADGNADATHGALALAVGHTQALFTPQAVDALVIDGPAGISCCSGSSPPAPAGTRPREVAEEGPQGELVIAWHRRREALGGPGLSDDATSPSLRYPEPLFEGHDGSPAAIRG